MAITPVETSKPADRERLVAKVQSMLLDPKKGTVISFADEVNSILTSCFIGILSNLTDLSGDCLVCTVGFQQ